MSVAIEAASAAAWGDLMERSGQGAQCRIVAWHGNTRWLVTATIRNAGGGFAGEHKQ